MVEAIGTWFAGIVTAGSLWLGFSILRRDRTKEEREQAEQVVVSYRLEMRSGLNAGEDVEIYIHNTSARPIRQPIFIAEGRRTNDVIRELKQSGATSEDPLVQRLRGTDKIGPEMQEGWLDRSQGPDHPIETIPADGQKKLIVKLSMPHICYEFLFSFFDYKGIYWTRNVVTHELTRAEGEPRWKSLPRRTWRRIAGVTHRN
jgi:hypothetical protein